MRVRLRLRRRVLPFMAATVVAVLAALPTIFPERFDRRDALLWTFVFLTAVFGFKAYEFGLIAWRISRHGERLTVFGLSLVDFFRGLAVLALSFASLWGVWAWYTYHEEGIPGQTVEWFRIILTWGGSLVMFTGFAVDFEMRRADDNAAISE